MYIKATEVTAGGAVKSTNNTCKLTQNSTEYNSLYIMNGKKVIIK